MILMGYCSYCSKLTVTVARCSNCSYSYCHIRWGDIMESSTADKASAGAKRAGVSANDWRVTRMFEWMKSDFMTEVANAMKRGMTA